MVARALAIIYLLAAAAPLHAAPHLAFVYRAGETENLAHHLDCLAELVTCERSAYFQVWKDDWSRYDDAAIEDWKRLAERYRGRTLDVDDAAALPAPHRFQAARVDTFVKRRIAGLEADSLDDWQRRLELVVFARDADRMLEIARHFAPRFHAFWMREAGPALTQRAASFEELVARNDLVTFAEQLVHFYGAELPDGHRVVFHFLYQPRSSNLLARAESLENHSIVELRAGEKPERRITAVMHETFHHLYSSASAARHRDLVAAFARSRDPMTFGYYNVLNEVLATALGNGLVSRRVDPAGWETRISTPLSFYNDRFVDRAAKAILPLVEQTLASGGRLGDEAFVAAYLARVRVGLGELAESPLLLLRISDLAFAHEADRPSAYALQRKIVASSLETYATVEELEDALRDRSEQSAAILARPIDLTSNKALRRMLGAHALAGLPRSATYVYVVDRTRRAKIFLFVARTAEEFNRLFDEFASR